MPQRRAFLAASAGAALTLTATSTRAEFRRMPVELVGEIGGLRGLAPLGAASPDITLYEFFDYNCGYCRQSASDIPKLLKADRGLRYVLVNFAVLAPESILASRIALAFLAQKPKSYLAFHQKLFAMRGLKGADQAIEAALSLGADEKPLLDRANSDDTTEALIAAVKLGDNLGLQATPSYIGGSEGNVGFLDLGQKKAAVAALRRCERMTCG
jgi:protein-disulfide isomerase